MQRPVQAPTEPRPRGWLKKLGWTGSTYFAEGFPYSIVQTLAEVLFKEHGASLRQIGLTSLFHLPWNLKLFWGPLLDEYATKRKWLLWTEILITVVLVLTAITVSFPSVLAIATALFMVLAICSATHDIAIDGFYLEALDEEEQATYVGIRAPAYRVAMWFVASPMLLVIPRIGWAASLALCAGLMALLLAWHAWILPRPEASKRPLSDLGRRLAKPKIFLITLAVIGLVFFFRWLWTEVSFFSSLSVADGVALGVFLAMVVALAFLPRLRRMRKGDSVYVRAFVDFLEQDRVGLILAFIVFFRAGESFLLKMKYAFLRDIGISMGDVGWANGVALIASIAGPAIGGLLISKQGLRRWIWPFVVAQNALNLLYMVLASMAQDSQVSFEAVVVVTSIEAFGAGLGTAVFMVYIMRCCLPAHRAAHMAILTALMSISFTLAGTVSGFIVEWIGYESYFGLTFFATVPGMLLIPFLPHLDERAPSPPE